jgi:hypothetical protein
MMINFNRRSLLPLQMSAALLISQIGCSQDTTHGIVNGTVTLDGAPLPSGLIRFTPEDGQSPSADAAINDGTFEARVPVGKKRVTISAPKVVGKRKMYETPDSPTVDTVEELLPEQYNVRSTLTLTVTPGEQPAKFELQSGK